MGASMRAILSNGNAIALLSRVGRFLENAGALSYASLIPSRGFGTNRSTSARNARLAWQAIGEASP